MNEGHTSHRYVRRTPMPKYRVKTRAMMIRSNGHVIRPYRSMVIEQATRPHPARGMKVKRVG